LKFSIKTISLSLLRQEGEVIDLSQITDVRPGGVPQDPKLFGQLARKYGDNFEEKSLTICWGDDYVNIQYQHVVASDGETAKVSILFHMNNFKLPSRSMKCRE
jgi:PH domain